MKSWAGPPTGVTACDHVSRIAPHVWSGIPEVLLREGFECKENSPSKSGMDGSSLSSARGSASHLASCRLDGAQETTRFKSGAYTICLRIFRHLGNLP